MFSDGLWLLLVAPLVAAAVRPVVAPVDERVPVTRNEKLWASCEVKPSQVFRVDKAIAFFRDHEEKYEEIEGLRRGGVPAAVVFCLHGRESTWSFSRHLHEGSSLKGRTRYVPKGRPKKSPRNGSVYTFVESAEDALYVLKGLDRVEWGDLDTALHTIEKYNGTGYLRYHPDVNSPYLWAGTNHYVRGKYVADGRFSRTAVDKQLGCAAILKRMRDRGIDVGF